MSFLLEDNEDAVEMQPIKGPAVAPLAAGKGKDKPTSSALAVAKLLFAASEGRLEDVQSLVTSGLVFVDDVDYDKRTALHVAASDGHLPIVDYLVRSGANVNARDRYDATPLDDAIRHQQNAIATFLRDNGAKFSNNFALDLVTAASEGDTAKVQQFIENGVPIQSSDYDLRTPLHVAIANRRLETIQYLLEHGADLNARDRFDGTPYEEAHRSGVRLGEDPMLELIQRYTQQVHHESYASSAFKNPFFLTFFIVELVIGVLYAIFSEYGPGADAYGYFINGIPAIATIYAFYMDVHVMIFIGFGWLMTFLRRFGYTAIGLTFIIGSLSIQVYMLTITFWEGALSSGFYKVPININYLIRADFAAGAVLISFGALLGKVTFAQMLALGVLEVIFYSLNEAISIQLAIADVGGSMVIHAFGAFFGLAASVVLTHKTARGNRDNIAAYHSDIYSMFGTIFLWMFWPSFNAALAIGNAQHRAVVNTLLSLTGSCITGFLFSQFWRKERAFNMVDIQNATLAGGVAMGSAANFVLHPAFAIMIGAVAGIVSTFGFSKLQGFVEAHVGIHDTCGILNLHGIPGVIGGVVSMIAAAVSTTEIYSESQLYSVFPNRVIRSPNRQAQFQLLFMLITLAIAIITGFISAILVRLIYRRPRDYFLDSESWETPTREVPYFYDVRGEVQHNKDEPKKAPVSDVDEVMMKEVDKKLKYLDKSLRDQKREIAKRAALIEELGGSINPAAAMFPAHFFNNFAYGGYPQQSNYEEDIQMAAALGGLTEKVDALLRQNKELGSIE